MAAVRPGDRLRPHVKAFKSHRRWPATSRRAAATGRSAAPPCAEMEGMAAAGLGDDLLLANETLDQERLRRWCGAGTARITVAVDSHETVRRGAIAGGAEVLIDVDVGLPRCGCPPEEAGRLAELARTRRRRGPGRHGLRGPRRGQPRPCGASGRGDGVDGAAAVAPHDVGGGLSSAGGTGTYDLHDWRRRGAGRQLPADGHPLRTPRPAVPSGAVRRERTVVSTSAVEGLGAWSTAG